MRRFPDKFGQTQKLILIPIIVTIVILVTFCIYHEIMRQDARRQQIRYFQKNQEKNAAWLNSVEQKINSYYHQMGSDNNVLNLIAKNEYGKEEYYTLSVIQKNFLNIIDSEPELASIYLYSRNSNRVLSTQYMFAPLDYFPDHVIINRFYSQARHQKWFPSRYERDGDSSSSEIISFAAQIPFRSNTGTIVFNIKQQQLFAKLNLKKSALLILDRQNQIICSNHNQFMAEVYQRHQARLTSVHSEKAEPLRITDRGQHYYLFTTQLPLANWRVVSVIPESLMQEGFRNNFNALYGLLSVLLLSVSSLVWLFQNNYFQSLQVYQEKLKTNMPELIDNAISGILTGAYTHEEMIAKSRELGIDLSGDNFMTIVFQINNYYRFLLENQDYLPKTLLCREIHNQIKQYFESYKNAVISMELGKIVVLLSFNSHQTQGETMTEIARLICEIQRQVERQYHFTLKVAASEILCGNENIRTCFAQALQTLNYQRFSGQNSVLFYQELEPEASAYTYYPVTEIACLKEYLKNGNLAKFEQTMRQICRKLLAQQNIAEDWVNAIFANIFYEVIKVVLELGFLSKDIFGDEDLFVKLYTYESVEEKQAYLMKVCALLVKYRESKERNTQKLQVQRIVNYIAANYDKTISLEIVAAEVGMNPSYLSVFFKKELGVHFAEYIMLLRLKKALHLLRNGRLSVKETAAECGFDTVHSLIRNFKKYYHLTPSEFRNQK